ncbi:hypothetical protein [uncultured Robinsoniella sp.]|uniref:hypothetical protein n=1 Tax=Robinsoniella sp. TaxID=2496533 RepID=UPI00374FB5C5
MSYHDGYLCIPNHELMEKYQDVLTRKSMGEVKKIVERSKEMLEATLACDEDKVSAMLSMFGIGYIRLTSQKILYIIPISASRAYI